MDTNLSNESNDKDIIHRSVEKYFQVVETLDSEEFIEYSVIASKNDINESFNKLYDELIAMNYYPLLYRVNDITVLRVVRGLRRRIATSLKLSIIFFVATLASVALTGYYVALDFYSRLSALGIAPHEYNVTSVIFNSILFVLCVLAPLLIHEVGHWIVSRRYNIPASYPLLIPAPLISPLGTFGALIEMRFLPKSLVELTLMGVSGPLFGVLLALAMFTLSYVLSPKISLDVAFTALNEGIIEPLSIAPFSIYVVTLMFRSIGGASEVTLLNPAAFASLIMLLIHFANLLPIGQLDGGHVIRGLTSIKTHSFISFATSSVAILAAVLSTRFLGGWLLWLGVFAILALILSGMRPHIGSANTLCELPKGFKVRILIIYLLLLMLTTPIPMISS